MNHKNKRNLMVHSYGVRHWVSKLKENFVMEEKKTFPNKLKLRELLTSRPALQEMPKGILQVEKERTLHRNLKPHKEIKISRTGNYIYKHKSQYYCILVL